MTDVWLGTPRQSADFPAIDMHADRYMASQIVHVTNSTTDHNQIRKWAEERGAKPACVRGTADHNDIGVIRLDFPGFTGEDKLQPMSWDDWFDKFEERKLALIYQDETAGGQKTNFNKLVSRENVV